jgi:hypothetical protein
VEGCFTTYNPALERSALKKDRYLNPAPAVDATANATPSSVTRQAPAPEAQCRPAKGPPLAPAPPPRPPVVAGNSLMAEKMLQAGLLRPKQAN